MPAGVGQRVALIATVLIVSGMLVDIQGGILQPLVGIIAADLQLTAGEVGWILNAMTLGSAVAVGLATRLGDTYGHRKVLITLATAAVVGCVLCALGTSFWPLVVGRFLMGIAVALPLAWGMLRPRATGNQIRLISIALATVMAFFTPVALVLGGLAVAWGLPWQSVFWLILALYGVLLAFAFASPETPAEVRSKVALDWVGVIGLGVWVTAMLLAISEGPAQGWTSPFVLTVLGIGIVTLVAWIIQQRNAKVPVMSFRDMDLRQTLTGYSAILSIAVVAMGVFLVMPSLLQTPAESGFGLGLTPLEATLPLLAQLPGAALAYLWTRWGLRVLGPKAVLVISGIAAVGTFLGFAFLHSEAWMFYLWCGLYGLTIMTCWNAGFALVAASGRQDNTATTFGVQSIIQFLGTAFSVAITLNVMSPGPSGFIPEGTYTGIYIGYAVVLAVLVLAWLFSAPSRVFDRHAVDTESMQNTLADTAYESN